MDRIDWGIYLITAKPPEMTHQEVINNSIAFAIEAEKLGYTHAWVLEHHFTPYGLVGSALTQAAFLLGATSTLRIGTAVQVLPLHHPVRLAEEVALIDQLSEGRLMFGIGRGVFRKDFTVFGADMSKSREMAIESLDIMRRCWTEGHCSSENGFYRFPDIEVYPQPFTKPHPLIYTVAISPETIAWAGKEGLPLIFGWVQTDEEMAMIIDEYNEHADRAGHDIGTIPHVISCLGGVSTNGDDIRSASRAHLEWWMDQGYQATELYSPGAPSIPSYEWRQREHQQRVLRGIRSARDVLPDHLKRNPIGSPQECIDKLNRTIKITGIKRFAFGFEAVGRREAVLDSMRRYASDVLPFVG